MNGFDEDPTVLNALLDLEILVDRTVGQVWRQWVDMGSWVTSHHITEVSDIKRAVGAITRVAFKQAKAMGYAPPHFHYCKIIKLVPERQYVLKTYSAKGGSYGMEMTCFDEARFLAVEGQTKIIYRFAGEYKGEAVLKGSSIEKHDEDDHMMMNLKNLKSIVEGQPRSEE